MKNKNLTFIIDFDSTFITVETLDEYAKLTLNNNANKIKNIEEITNNAMNGKIDFRDALAKRLNILKFKKNNLKNFINHIKTKISRSFISNQKFIKENDVYIVSGGFKEIIEPIVQPFGINSNKIFANSFIFENDLAIDFDKNEIMAGETGKVDVLSHLNLNKKIIVIGDGYTDYQMKKMGKADLFIAYIESIKRKNVIKNADFTANSFNEIVEYIKNL